MWKRRKLNRQSLSLVLNDRRQLDDVTLKKSSCCGNGERSVADCKEPCQWYGQCLGWWWKQAFVNEKVQQQPWNSLLLGMLAVMLIVCHMEKMVSIINQQFSSFTDKLYEGSFGYNWGKIIHTNSNRFSTGCMICCYFFYPTVKFKRDAHHF